MKITVETTLANFYAWSGGETVLKELDGKAFDIIENFIDEWSDENQLTETDINDFLWIDAEDYLREEHGLNLDGSEIDED